MKKYKIGNRIITANSPVEAVKVSKILDSATEEIEYLTEEEERAVDDYRKAIAGTTNPKLLELYKHILDEELEHIRELENADVEDCDMKDMPDLETKSGKKQYFEQIAMSSLDGVPARLWSKVGDKINIDNAKITLLIKEDGVYLLTANGSSKDRFTTKSRLNEEILRLIDK